MTHNRESSVGGGQQRAQRDTEAEKSGKKIKSRSPLAWKMKGHTQICGFQEQYIQIEFYIEGK
jgi:hypothetical protein